MKFSCIICCVAIFETVKTQLMESDENDNQKVVKFVGDLVRDASKRDPPQNYDVLLLQVENHPQNNFFERISLELGPENILQTFTSQKPIEIEVLQHNSMIVMVTDGVGMQSLAKKVKIAKLLLSFRLMKS